MRSSAARRSTGVHGASRLGTVAVIDALTFGMIAGEEFAKMA